MCAFLTVGEVRMADPQLQAGGGWTLLGAIRGVQQQLEVPLQRVQQSLEDGVVGLV